MTDLQAALAVPQLERLDETNAARQANAARLTGLLGGPAGLVLPDVPKGREHVWHQYTVLLPEGVDRGQVQARMREAGVEAGVYYPRLAWDYPIYRDHPQIVPGDTPVARSVTGRCLSLPVHPRLTAEDLEQVATALLGALEATV
jgi:perosamine synthetase